MTSWKAVHEHRVVWSCPCARTFPEVSGMLLLPRRGRKPLRLIPVPLPDSHPDWPPLDRQLPPRHLARRVRALVEQIDLTPLLDSFAGVGSPAHPPDLLLQFVLFEIQRKHLSPALWARDARESLPARWLLRGLRPARCVFYRFRDHLPQELMDALNAQILRLAQDEGHTTARAGALDGTFHAALGSRHHLLNATALDQRCELLDAALAQEQGPGLVEPTEAPPAPGLALPAAAGPSRDGSDHAGPDQATAAARPSPPPAPASDPAAAADPAGGAAPKAARRPGWMARSRAGRQRQRRRYEQARQALRTRLADHQRKQRRQRKAQRRPAERVTICPSEPEAALGRDKSKVFRPLYNTQVVQDVEGPFVLGYGVYATSTDAGLLPPMLERTRALTGRDLEEVLVDGMYARLLDVRYCVAHGVRLYAPLPAASPPGPTKGPDEQGPLGKEQFAWLAPEHTYRCPRGHLLHLERRCREERRDGDEVMVEQYRCPAEHCRACPLASRCTTKPDKGRTVKRMEGQELLDEVRERAQSLEGKRRYRKRCQTVELRHADLRAHRGLDRFPSYGLRRARGLIGLLVLAHNGLALLEARDAKKANNREVLSPP
jgi:hypothetical protein